MTAPAAQGTGWTVRLALANSIGFSATTVLPLWIAALPGSLGEAPWRVGLVGTLQLLACGMTNLAAPWLTARWAPLNTARVALCVAAAGCLGEGLALRCESLALVLFGTAAILSGGGLGVLLAMTNRIMAGSDHAQRGYAVFQIVEVCFASTLFIAGARLVHGGGGRDLFLTLALVCALGLLPLHRVATPGQVSSRRARPEPSVGGGKKDGIPLLFALLCFFAGQSSINSYLIPIGASSGLADDAVARIVGTGMIFALGGAAAARAMGERFGTVRPIAVVAGCLALDFVVMTAPAPPLIFAAGAALIPSGTIFVVPYFFTALARADGEGRLAALGPAFLIGGVSSGPLIAGLIHHDSGYARVGWVASVLVISSAVLVSTCRETIDNVASIQR